MNEEKAKMSSDIASALPVLVMPCVVSEEKRIEFGFQNGLGFFLIGTEYMESGIEYSKRQECKCGGNLETFAELEQGETKSVECPKCGTAWDRSLLVASWELILGPEEPEPITEGDKMKDEAGERSEPCAICGEPLGSENFNVLGWTEVEGYKVHVDCYERDGGLVLDVLKEDAEALRDKMISEAVSLDRIFELIGKDRYLTEAIERDICAAGVTGAKALELAKGVVETWGGSVPE